MRDVVITLPPALAEWLSGLEDPSAFVAEAVRKSIIEAGIRETIYRDAALAVVETRDPSPETIQARLGIDYPRAAMLLEMMEQRGVVGRRGDGPRHVLLSRAAFVSLSQMRSVA